MDKDRIESFNLDESETPEQRFHQAESVLSPSNVIIREWRETAEAVLQQHKDTLDSKAAERGNTTALEFVSYPTIHKNLKLPDDLHMLVGGERATIAINFQNRPRSVLRLYLCSIAGQQSPQKIYAALHYQFGRQIGFLLEDAGCDVQMAKLRFKEWFSAQMAAMIKAWLDQS